MSAPLWCRFARPSCVPVRRGNHDPRRQGRVLIGAGRQVPADPQRGLGSGDSAGLQGLAAHSGPGLDVGVPVSRAMGTAVLETGCIQGGEQMTGTDSVTIRPTRGLPPDYAPGHSIQGHDVCRSRPEEVVRQ